MRAARPALALASPDFLVDVSDRLRGASVPEAIVNRESSPIVDWVLRLFALQGISDRGAFAFDERHGGVRSLEIEAGLRLSPPCSVLRCYWSFQACRYRKGKRTCAAPELLPGCPLPRHDLRKGGLNVAAYGLHLFVRDVCRGDLVGWIDTRLADADRREGASARAARMRDAIIVPLSCIPNTGPKLWNMILADLLLAGDQNRERWVTTGAYMIAIDTLVHNFLHRTGALRRHGAEHTYGSACHGPNACAHVIEALAEQIDARQFNPVFPVVFPRFIQHAIWQFCAAGGRNICNGVQVDARQRCQQAACPVFAFCDRIAVA